MKKIASSIKKTAKICDKSWKLIQRQKTFCSNLLSNPNGDSVKLKNLNKDHKWMLKKLKIVVLQSSKTFHYI